MRTYAVQKGTSALPPKADMCGATSSVGYGPKRTFHHSFDHLVAKRRRLGGVFKQLDFALLELKVVHLSISQGSFEPDRVTEMGVAVFDN